MKKVLHVSSECYPAAKAGGMGDVVGALPLYFPLYDFEATVVIPKYKTKWITSHKFKKVYSGTFIMAGEEQVFRVEKLENKVLDYPFYCIDLPGLFDRESIYLAENGHGFEDEPKRNIGFQTAVLEWLVGANEKFDIIHVHDHMTGLIPFFMQHCDKFNDLKNIPSVFTIHNGAYSGIFNWNEVHSFLPHYDNSKGGLLDWDNKINSLATAIKCAWSITTVSPSYMKELIYNSGTLNPLYQTESYKCSGILNGIDSNLWNPETDPNLVDHFDGDWKKFKSTNKSYLQSRFKLYKRRPVFGFIGRFAYQKGADLLMNAIRICFKKNMKINVVILGSGDKSLEDELVKLHSEFPKEVGAFIGYDEGLARNIYAGCDFLLMPSRFEPCGLNQLYSMRYGTIPIASNKGGLKDTVVDVSEEGQGIVISELEEEQIVIAIERAISLYKNKKEMSKLIKTNGDLNYSWENSTSIYAELYSNHLKS